MRISDNVTCPSYLGLAREGNDAGQVGLLLHSSVVDLILPADPQKFPEAVEVMVEASHYSCRYSHVSQPYRRVVRTTTGANSSPLPHCLSHSPESTTGFGDSISDLDINDIYREREGTARVCEILYCLQALIFDSDARIEVTFARDRLEHHFGLVNTDGDW